jgi:cytochrome c oxidase subunit 2
MPTWLSVSFQDNISMSIEHILFFHDHAIVILVLIVILTLYLIISMILRNRFNKFIIERQEVETIWTILPALMLVFIAVPSLKTLYLIEESPNVTIKITGHQWYWSYEQTSLDTSDTDSFIENSSTLRLLKTREILNLPVNTRIRAVITSADVIHSWALPTIGIKVDAMPGRLNQTFLYSKRLGLYTPSCPS